MAAFTVALTMYLSFNTSTDCVLARCFMIVVPCCKGFLQIVV